MDQKQSETQCQNNYENCLSEPVELHKVQQQINDSNKIQKSIDAHKKILQSESYGAEQQIVNKYFIRQKTQQTSNNPQVKFQEQINKKLSLMIENGKLKISQQSQRLSFQPKDKCHSENSQITLKEKIRKLSQRKYQTLQQLKQLQKDQLEVKRFSISFKKTKATINKLSRSFFMKQQREKIKQIIIENQQLQHQLNQKTNQAINRYRQQVKIDIIQHIKQKQASREKHKQQAKHFLQSLKSRKQERQQFIQKTNKKYQQLKTKKYLFHQKQQEEQIRKRQRQSEEAFKINQIKRKLKIKTLQDIHQHQDKYKQILRQKNQLRLSRSRLIHQNINKQNTARTKVQSNYFSHLVKTQIMKIKETQKQKKRRSLQYKEKIINFKEHIDKDIRPKIKITNESTFITDKKIHSLHSLNFQQQRSKGKQYLSQAKRMKKFESSQQQKAIKKFEHQKKTTYKNYLQQVRKHSQDCTTQESQKIKFNRYLQKEGTISQYNSLNRAVLKAEQLSAKSKKSNDQRLIDIVQTKINLLKMIVL